MLEKIKEFVYGLFDEIEEDELFELIDEEEQEEFSANTIYKLLVGKSECLYKDGYEEILMKAATEIYERLKWFNITYHHLQIEKEFSRDFKIEEIFEIFVMLTGNQDKYDEVINLYIKTDGTHEIIKVA